MWLTTSLWWWSGTAINIYIVFTQGLYFKIEETTLTDAIDNADEEEDEEFSGDDDESEEDTDNEEAFDDIEDEDLICANYVSAPMSKVLPQAVVIGNLAMLIQI